MVIDTPESPATAPTDPAPLVLDLGCDQGVVRAVIDGCDAESLPVTVRRFPDGESYLRVDGDCAGRDVVVMASLERPDRQLMPLLLAGDVLRDLGARDVGLVAPYLAYMRQDHRFRDGESVSSRTFASLVSDRFDWLASVDPHLHRYRSLDEVYAVPSTVIRSAGAVAAWVVDNVRQPLLIGPDAESEQWVSDVAARVSCPWLVLEKIRSGDRDVAVSVPDIDRWPDATPVLLDDIVSTGCTMAAALEHLRDVGARSPVCIAVHGVFADGARELLMSAGAKCVMTTNTLPQQDDPIDVADAVADAVSVILAGRTTARRAAG